MNPSPPSKALPNRSDGIPEPTGTTLEVHSLFVDVRRRVSFFLTGVVIPLICVAFVWAGGETGIDPPPQSGELKDYAVVMLRWPAIGEFLPCIAFSAASLASWTLDPRLNRYFLVRIGVYSGIPVLISIDTLVTLYAACFLAIFAAAPALNLITYIFAAATVAQQTRVMPRSFELLPGPHASGTGIRKPPLVDGH